MRSARDFSLSVSRLPFYVRRMVCGMNEVDRCVLLLHFYDMAPELIAKNREVFEYCKKFVTENMDKFIEPVDVWHDRRKEARGW